MDNLNIINNCIWKIIDNNENYILNVNDIINIGGFNYIIKEINIDEDLNNNDNSHMNFNENNFIFKLYPDNIKQKKCNICQCMTVNLCECEEYEHFKFIKDNITNKKTFSIKKNDNNSIKTYYCTLPHCERCKTICPLRFKLYKSNEEKEFEEDEEEENDNYIEFIEIERPPNNHIILESLGHINKNNNNLIDKYIHIIQLTGKEIIIGKNENGELIFDNYKEKIKEEICFLKYDNKSKKIELKSKNDNYGIFLLIKESLKIKEKEINIKVDRSIINLKLMKKNEFEKIKNNNTKYPLYCKNNPNK